MSIAIIALSSALFVADYPSSNGGLQNDVHTTLKVGGRFVGTKYQQEGEIAFVFSGETVKIWATDIEEITLGSAVKVRGADFEGEEELYDLIRGYIETILPAIS
jgi:hypothetical protein